MVFLADFLMLLVIRLMPCSTVAFLGDYGHLCKAVLLQHADISLALSAFVDLQVIVLLEYLPVARDLNQGLPSTLEAVFDGHVDRPLSPSV